MRLQASLRRNKQSPLPGEHELSKPLLRSGCCLAAQLQVKCCCPTNYGNRREVCLLSLVCVCVCEFQTETWGWIVFLKFLLTGDCKCFLWIFFQPASESWARREILIVINVYWDTSWNFQWGPQILFRRSVHCNWFSLSIQSAPLCLYFCFVFEKK